MNFSINRLRHMHPAYAFGLGTAFLALALFLAVQHVRSISEVRDVSVPLVATLPKLEKRLDTLKKQIELTELHAALRTGSQQEKVEVFVLPEETDLDRLVAVFEVVRDSLAREGVLSSMSDIELSSAYDIDNDMEARALSVQFAVHENGLQTITLLTRLAGLLTVGDALTDDELRLLVDRIEHENPAGIVALEQFLSTSLLDYAENPRLYEEQMRRSFSSTSLMNVFQNVLRTSLLRDAKRFLSGSIGSTLNSYKLWPLQMMTIKELSIEPGGAEGWYRMGLKVLVYNRK